MPQTSVVGAVFLMLAGLGCGSQPAGHAKATSPSPEDHRHERGKMLIADAGKYHALLTAHLAKDGNELDIFFETVDEQDPQPVALPLASVTAQVRAAEGELREVVFEPAPPDERPKDEKPGACSHFVAKAPWLQPTDKLYVVVRLTIDGQPVTARWKDFVPKKYAHHED